MAACLCLLIGVLVPLANSLFNAKGGGDFQDGVPAEPALIYFQGALYQCVYAVHEDTYNNHVHFVFNPNAPLGKGGCTLQGFKVVLVARRLAPITLSRTLWGIG